MSTKVQIQLVQAISNKTDQTILSNAFQSIVLDSLPAHIDFTISILAAGLDVKQDVTISLNVLEQGKATRPTFTQPARQFKADTLADGNNIFFHFDLANVAFEREGLYDVQVLLNNQQFNKTFAVKLKD